MRFIKKLAYFLGEGNEHAAFNIRFYEQLYHEIDISDLYEPVDFFERARNEYLFFYHHSSDYVAIVEHFTDLQLDTPRQYYLLYYLSNLISKEYADKENGAFIIRHEEVVLSSVAFINKLYQETKKAFDKESRRTTVDEKINHHIWQYPAWDKNDFVASQVDYKVTLNTFLFKDERGNPHEQPYYVLKKGDMICARLLPIEYFRLLAYEISIPQARNETGLPLRISRLKKIKSDFNTIATDIITTDDIGKKYPTFFDVSEIAKHIDVYVENIESAMALKAHLPDSAPVVETPDQLKDVARPNKLTVTQAALFCHYTGRVITRKNGAEIAREYGHTSGDALFNKYTFYQSKANRIGNPETKKKLSNKIQLFEKVAALLAGSAKNQIMSDLNSLQTTYSSQYT
jgi:hypothetical protein